MAKNIRRILAMVLVMCMFVSALPMQALAAERGKHYSRTKETQSFERSHSKGSSAVAAAPAAASEAAPAPAAAATSEGFTKTETFTGDSVKIESNGTSISITGTNSSGADLKDFSGTSDSKSDSYEDANTGSTIQKDTTHVEISGTESADGVDKKVEYMEDKTVVTETATDGTVTEQTITDGLETKEWTENDTEVGDPAPSVEVQLKPGETTTNHGTGTYTEVTDNVEGGSTESNSDKTTNTTVVDREVSGTLSNIGVTIEKTEEDLTAIAPENYEGKDYDNAEGLMVHGGNGQIHPDFFLKVWESSPESFKANAKLDAPLEQPTDLDGYDYQWTGYSDATNAYRAEAMDVVYKKNPDGTPYVNPETGEYEIESITYTGKYNDGMGSTPAIFALSKYAEDGTVEIFYGYCIDNDTEAVPTAWYKISNLEDSDYYPEGDESAKKLRAIVTNGYFGTESGTGSLAQIKDKLDAYYDENATVTFEGENGQMVTKKVSEVIDGLTEAEALTATQAAIWTMANGSLATQDGKDGTIITGIYSVDKPKSNLADVDREYSDDEDARLRAVYEWLLSLDGIEAKSTIINEKNNVKDMSLVVNKKVAERGDNDVYSVDLQFKLDFELTENDSLKVILTDADGNNIKDAEGHDIIIEKDLAMYDPDNTETDNSVLRPDKNGVYTLTGLQLSEGTDFSFNLTLDGTQKIEQDVYIYSAYGGTDKSQTMVGMASGTQEINISVSNTLSFEVNDKVQKKEERVWHRDFDPVITPPEEPTTPPEEPTTPPDEPNEPATPAVVTAAVWTAPENQRLANEEAVEIPEEPVPLAAPAITGDDTGIWVMALLMIACCMVAINVFDKKRNHETF